MIDLSDGHCALMILRALQERGGRRGKPVTRARFSKLTLKKLCHRETITQAWVDRVNEPLMKAGWMLFDAGTTYGAVKVSVVENWPRTSTKYLVQMLDQVKNGKFDFSQLEGLLRKEVWETTTHLRGPKSRQAKPNKK